MKPLALCVLALAAVTFFTGCAPAGEGYYTPSQAAAHHAGYDPTGHVYRETY